MLLVPDAQKVLSRSTSGTAPRQDGVRAAMYTADPIYKLHVRNVMTQGLHRKWRCLEGAFQASVPSCGTNELWLSGLLGYGSAPQLYMPNFYMLICMYFEPTARTSPLRLQP